MCPSQIESLKWLEIGARERAVRIDHDSAIDNLRTGTAIDTQTGRIPQLSRK
jgi:hypothetical protein